MCGRCLRWERRQACSCTWQRPDRATDALNNNERVCGVMIKELIIAFLPGPSLTPDKTTRCLFVSRIFWKTDRQVQFAQFVGIRMGIERVRKPIDRKRSPTRISDTRMGTDRPPVYGYRPFDISRETTKFLLCSHSHPTRLYVYIPVTPRHNGVLLQITDADAENKRQWVCRRRLHVAVEG